MGQNFPNKDRAYGLSTVHPTLGELFMPQSLTFSTQRGEPRTKTNAWSLEGLGTGEWDRQVWCSWAGGRHGGRAVSRVEGGGGA